MAFLQEVSLSFSCLVPPLFRFSDFLSKSSSSQPHVHSVTGCCAAKWAAVTRPSQWPYPASYVRNVLNRVTQQSQDFIWQDHCKAVDTVHDSLEDLEGTSRWSIDLDFVETTRKSCIFKIVLALILSRAPSWSIHHVSSRFQDIRKTLDPLSLHRLS